MRSTHTQSHTQPHTIIHNHTISHTHNHKLFQTLKQYSSKIPPFSYLFIWTEAYLTQKSLFFGLFLL